MQLPGILEAQKMGLDVVVCDYYEDCPGKRVPGVIPELISTYDYEGVLAAAKKHQIDAITTLCTDYPMRIVAHVAEQLGLPGISLADAVRATDKGEMRECLAQNNVPIPQYEIVKTKDDFMKAIKGFSGKTVIKAVDNSGSRGIQMVDDPSDEAVVSEAYDYCVEFSRSGDILIEEFMAGPEVCVETLNYKGECYPIQITDQIPKEPPYFTDAGYSQCSILPEETLAEISRIAVAANKALNNHTGSSCTEIIVTPNGPKVVEVGPRLAGDYMTSHLVPLSTGVNMVEGIIKIALGEEPNVTPTIKKGSAIKFYMKETLGIIKSIEGVEDAQKVDGVVEIAFMKNVGDEAVPLRSSNDRICYVIAQGDTPEHAIDICTKALEMIVIETE